MCSPKHTRALGVASSISLPYATWLPAVSHARCFEQPFCPRAPQVFVIMFVCFLCISFDNAFFAAGAFMYRLVPFALVEVPMFERCGSVAYFFSASGDSKLHRIRTSGSSE